MVWFYQWISWECNGLFVLVVEFVLNFNVKFHTFCMAGHVFRWTSRTHLILFLWLVGLIGWYDGLWCMYTAGNHRFISEQGCVLSLFCDLKHFGFRWQTCLSTTTLQSSQPSWWHATVSPCRTSSSTSLCPVCWPPVLLVCSSPPTPPNPVFRPPRLTFSPVGLYHPHCSLSLSSSWYNHPGWLGIKKPNLFTYLCKTVCQRMTNLPAGGNSMSKNIWYASWRWQYVKEYLICQLEVTVCQRMFDLPAGRSSVCQRMIDLPAGGDSMSKND